MPYHKINRSNPPAQAATPVNGYLMATQRVGTKRRSEGKSAQEAKVKEALLGCGFNQVKKRDVLNFAHAPEPGTFCDESLLGDRKADIIVRLWDYRIMAIECKVSNSATNSIKRLKNDAAVKAVHWVKQMGQLHVVPSAVLSGVYKLSHLQQAQQDKLSIFWSHDLESMTRWIESAR